MFPRNTTSITNWICVTFRVELGKNIKHILYTAFGWLSHFVRTFWKRIKCTPWHVVWTGRKKKKPHSQNDRYYLQAIRVPSSNRTRQEARRYRLPTHPSQAPHVASQSTPTSRIRRCLPDIGVKYRDSYAAQSAIESATTGAGAVAADGSTSRANSTRPAVPRPEHEYRRPSAGDTSRTTSERSVLMYTRFDSTGSAMPSTTSVQSVSFVCLSRIRSTIVWLTTIAVIFVEKLGENRSV